ncbi:hypothetical protein A5788_05335 [Gordonia sp. 852002-50816_SCH5313054-c]|nr:hypothetical protein A5785_05085 [Gordonia sp. 852002-50395_SCH5434458]OBC20846.1 hypothetical protein A5788_05335 [Gordonia sp. 852002-50816_SCH5313054-c]
MIVFGGDSRSRTRFTATVTTVAISTPVATNSHHYAKHIDSAPRRVPAEIASCSYLDEHCGVARAVPTGEAVDGRHRFQGRCLA